MSDNELIIPGLNKEQSLFISHLSSGALTLEEAAERTLKTTKPYYTQSDVKNMVSSAINEWRLVPEYNTAYSMMLKSTEEHLVLTDREGQKRPLSVKTMHDVYDEMLGRAFAEEDDIKALRVLKDMRGNAGMNKKEPLVNVNVGAAQQVRKTGGMTSGMIDIEAEPDGNDSDPV